MAQIRKFKDYTKANTDIMNRILDKISKSGYDSLTNTERAILKNIDKKDYNDVLTQALLWLDENYGDLTPGKERVGFGEQVIEATVFKDKNGKVIIEHINGSNMASIDIDIWAYLMRTLDIPAPASERILTKWVVETYDMPVRTTSMVFLSD